MLQGQLRGPGAFAHGRTGDEGSFMMLRERRVQQNIVRNQELWQLGEDSVIRESTNCEQRVELEREQQESVRVKEGPSRSWKKRNGNWFDNQLQCAKCAVDKGACSRSLWHPTQYLEVTHPWYYLR